MENNKIIELENSIKILECELAKQKRINSTLIERIENGTTNNINRNAILSSNIYLKESIIRKTKTLETKDNKLISLINENEKVEHALKLSETRFKAFFEVPIVGFIIADINGNLIQFNEKFASIFGYEKDELINSNLRILQNDLTSINDSILFEHLHKGIINSLNIERIYYKKDGIPITIELSATVFFDETVNKHYFGIIIQDLSGKKEEEERRKTIEDRFRRFTENSPAFVCAFDTNFDIYYVNPALCNFMKMDKSEIIGKKFYDFIKLKSNKDYAIFRLKNLTPESPIETHDQMFTDVTGDTKWQQWTNIAYFDNSGKVIDYHSIGIDITDRKLYEAQILLAKENAEKSEKMKLAFLSQISHEIRTPVSGILSYLSLIKEYFLSKPADESTDYLSYFKIIDNSSNRLIRTIDLILNLSELQTHSYTPHYGYINVKEILQSIIILHEPAAKNKGINYIFNFNLKETEFFTDEYAFTQIFENLITNAIKYTDKGSVIVDVIENDLISFIVSIKDTGIGMSEEYQKKIYTPFSQEDTGYNRKYEGNGLGLALTKLYVEVTNAEISFSSQKGIGTQFYVRFFR
ncbi:MAG TPA: PAS domain-containing sensor histidine kinase [Melioribacteraceae bacterium]|nr:PAS domain-containing sensor histidine kinase [Melioribacteraceae bacterium]